MRRIGKNQWVVLEKLREKVAGKSKVEDKIKRSRLESTIKVKKEMEEKVKLLDEKLRLLSQVDYNSVPSPKIEFQKKVFVERKKEDSEEQKRHAVEFAKKMIINQKETNRKKEVLFKQMEEKIAKDKEREELEKKQKEEEEEKQRKELLLKKIEESHAKRQEQQSKIANDTALPKKKYLYEVIQQEYESISQFSELEKRKKIIAEKRNVYKPIRRCDFLEHERNYESQIKKKEEERKKEKIKAQTEDPAYKHKVEQYKTKFADDAMKSATEAKAKLKATDAYKKGKMEKMLTYAKAAQETYAPIQSVEKAKEVQNTIEKLTKPKRRSNSSKKISRSSKHSAPPNETDITQPLESKPGVPKAPIIYKKRANTKDQPKEDQPKKKIDYLSELRNKGVMRKVEDIQRTTDYESVIKSEKYSPREKLEKVRDQASNMERQARKKELLLNSKVSGKGFLEVENEVSDMYIQAIKAKLSLFKL
jgi:hypothetical protein